MNVTDGGGVTTRGHRVCKEWQTVDVGSQSGNCDVPPRLGDTTLVRSLPTPTSSSEGVRRVVETGTACEDNSGIV